MKHKNKIMMLKRKLMQI